MAKDFGKANSIKTIKEVAKASNEKANIIQVKMINSENLIDYPKNHENLNDTADLENSMKELGFTDPIEVTTFNMEDGKYMIISGHRRRVAGLKVDINTFPCIIKNFSNENDLRNYVLLANSQRDSAKDPLLFCARYKMHEEYLIESNFKGSVREEIAKRLGISVQQADRFNQFNKIILPVWDMVRAEICGMSSVLGMASHEVFEQEQILKIMNEAIEQGVRLTRDTCDKIVKGYRGGKKTYKDIIGESEQQQPISETIRDSGLPLNAFINPEPSETKDSPSNRNNEVRREIDNISKDELSNNYNDEKLTEEDYETIDAIIESEEKEQEKKEKPVITAQEKQNQNAENISKTLAKLEGYFNEVYTFEDKDRARSVMNTMGTIAQIMFSEMCDIAQEYDQEKDFQIKIGEMMKSLDNYK